MRTSRASGCAARKSDSTLADCFVPFRHLGQGQDGDLGIRLDLQRGAGFAHGVRPRPARQRRLRQHHVGFHHVAVRRDQALQHGGGRFLVLGAHRQLLHLEHHQAARTRGRFGQALFQHIFCIAEVVGQQYQPQIVLVGFIGIRRVLAPQLDRGEGVVGLLGGQRHLGGALGQARIPGLLGQAHQRQVGTLPVALLEGHLGIHELDHHGRGHVHVRRLFPALLALLRGIGGIRPAPGLGGGQRPVGVFRSLSTLRLLLGRHSTCR